MCLFYNKQIPKSDCLYFPRAQYRGPSPPTSPTRRWPCGRPTPQACRPRPPSCPRPTSPPPSARCRPWSPTRRWPSGTRAPPTHRMPWGAPTPRGTRTRPGAWTPCQSTLCPVSGAGAGRSEHTEILVHLPPTLNTHIPIHCLSLGKDLLHRLKVDWW